MLEANSEKDCDVLIVGAGCTGLYAALLLSSMDISVTIIDKRQCLDDPGGPALYPGFLWSPRTLQILHTFDLAQPLAEIGQRHWTFETFTNKGHGNSAVTSERQQHRVWENDASDFSCSLSCKRDQICAALSEALERKTNVSVLYDHELVDLEGDHSHIKHGNQLLTIKSRYLLGADGINSFVRQKLGIAYQRTKSASVYYTLEATVHTNFPGARSISTVAKDEYTLFIVGHRNNRVFIMFEHSPKWSRLTIDDDVPVKLAQRHIRSTLEPYQIEFANIHAYYRWSADERTAEELSIDRRIFLLGSAAQSVSPPGILTSDLGIEQAHNLCWKLCLCLKHQASPELLDTFEAETRSKRDDMSAISKALLQFIHHQDGLKGLNSTPNREVGYQLQRNKLNLLGESPYHANLINLSTVSTASFLAHSIDTVEATTALFERIQTKSQPGAPGTLAQNARLKPYTLYDLLMSQCPNTSSTCNDDRPPKPSSSSSPNGKQNGRFRRTRSNSTSGWLAPLLQSVTKRSNDQKSAHRASLQPSSRDTNGNHTSRHSSSSGNIPLDRWRSIKTNYYQLMDRILFCGSPSSFTILVFCGSLADRENLSILQKFRRHLEEPQSFVQQYEPTSSSRLSFGYLSDQPRASVSSSHRSSSESTLFSSSQRFSLSPPTSPITPFSTGRASLDQPRPSMSMFQPPSSSSSSSTSPLFSFMYITASSKAEAVQFLTSTKPAIVHATFPMGLERVYIDHDKQSHTVFGIKGPTVTIIRPDGYIGASFGLQYDQELEKLDSYFDAFLRPPIDMTSAAALAADYYDL